jgi:hypothetical protein
VGSIAGGLDRLHEPCGFLDGKARFEPVVFVAPVTPDLEVFVLPTPFGTLTDEVGLNVDADARLD